MAYRQPSINFQHTTSTYQQPITRVSAAPQPTYIRESQAPLRASRIAPGHNSVMMGTHTHYKNTDNLYRPLQETLQHPEIVRNHQQFSTQAAKSSMVSRQYRRLNTKEYNNLQENTLIPDAELVPTDHLEKVRGERFVAVDATQRITGEAITQEEMDRIRQKGFKSSQVVYEPREEIVEERVETRVVERPVQVRETKVAYNPPAYDNYGKKPQLYKYNLYSCIDQPVNECRLNGCGKCSGCPGNEVIAKQNHPPSIINP